MVILGRIDVDPFERPVVEPSLADPGVDHVGLTVRIWVERDKLRRLTKLVMRPNDGVTWAELVKALED